MPLVNLWEKISSKIIISLLQRRKRKSWKLYLVILRFIYKKSIKMSPDWNKFKISGSFIRIKVFNGLSWLEFRYKFLKLKIINTNFVFIVGEKKYIEINWNNLNTISCQKRNNNFLTFFVDMQNAQFAFLY